MQGVSVVFASGDSGVAGPSGDENADGCLGDGSVFSPDFPATCPYVTTVGATYLPSGANVFKDQEVAVTRFASGGGLCTLNPNLGKVANCLRILQHLPNCRLSKGSCGRVL